jgi:hypothetical protein
LRGLVAWDKDMKKFYLFTQKGITDRFFCGNIYEALPSDMIKIYREVIDFETCVQSEFCKEFETRKQANEYSRMEEKNMEDSDNYASRAMECENVYGREGVDDMRFEN